MSNAVGFQMQGDVFAGGTLTWQAAGRLFKALSDGGIDPYSLSALIQLGKIVQVSDNLKNSISRLVLSRCNRTRFISKALWLGWGHTEIANELIKTQAGTSAMALITAFSTGISNFEAAGALVELMRECGCEPDMLPSVDALKPTVAYLSPIVRDCGFADVLSQIKLQCEAKINSRLCYDGLRVGEAPKWVQSLNVLLSAHSEGENLTICAQQRAFWLAAFASFALQMQVKVFVRPEDEMPVWQCAGTGPRLVVCLEAARRDGILLLEPPSSSAGELAIEMFCRSQDLFPGRAMWLSQRLRNSNRVEAKWRERAQNSDYIEDECAFLIGKMCIWMLKNPRFQNIVSIGRITLNRLLSTVTHLSIPPNPFQRGIEEAESNPDAEPERIEYKLYPDQLFKFSAFMASLVFVFSFCQLDVDGLMVYEDWNALLVHTYKFSLNILAPSPAYEAIRDWTIGLPEILEHLALLLGGPKIRKSGMEDRRDRLLALSADDIAIYPSCLVESERGIFSSQPFTISKGRLSYKGQFRAFVTQGQRGLIGSDAAALLALYGEVMTWPSKTLLAPHHRPGPVRIETRSYVTDEHIIIDLIAGHREWPGHGGDNNQRWYPLDLLSAYQSACTIPQLGPCRHERLRACQLEASSAVLKVASFGLVSPYLDPMAVDTDVQSTSSQTLVPASPKGEYIFVGSSGAPLEQLFQATQFAQIDGLRSQAHNDVVFQGGSCLECAFQQAQMMGARVIIMQ